MLQAIDNQRLIIMSHGQKEQAQVLLSAEEDEVAEGRDQFYEYIESKQSQAAEVLEAVYFMWPYSSGG